MESIEHDITLANILICNIPKNGVRLHILGIPYSITKQDYSHCAYTGKIQRFSPMMRSRGYEVYHYGVEGSESGADKNIDILTKEEWDNLKFLSFKELNPEFTDTQIQQKINDITLYIGTLNDNRLILYREFNKRAKKYLKENYRSTSTDIVCLPFGIGHYYAIDGENFVSVESGIGYDTQFCNYRIFESYAFMHRTQGIQKNMDGHNYWFVIPNYYDTIQWPLSLTPKKNTIGFFGRINNGKGLQIIVDIAKRFPEVYFIICGQGDPVPFMVNTTNIFYKPPIHGIERGNYLGSLTALIAPTLWIEPFCGVAVEAQLCGTPVLTVDYGAQTETVEPFKTGFHCHTLADFCYGVQMALDGKFDRQYIRNRAVEKYDMYNLAKKYDYAFKNILDIHNGKNGYYAEESHLECLK